jgi:hypothetical protein
MARVARAQWPLLVGAGLLVFVPLGLIEVLDERLQEPLGELGKNVDAGRIVAAVTGALGHAGASLVGEVLYAGVVAAAVLGLREGQRHSLGEIARALPYRRLILADLLWVLAVAVGLVLLIVPGLIAMAWFALVGPVIKVERLRVIEGFRRSAALVRGHTVRVLALILPVLVAGDLLSDLIQSGSGRVLGDGFFSDWLAATAADLLSSPIYALAAVGLYAELRDRPL